MAWSQPPVRPSRWTQQGAGPATAGFSQVPQGPPNGLTQVTDKNNPAARNYALQRLHSAVLAGLVPHFMPEWNADPAKAWRGVSALLAQNGQFQDGGQTSGANLVNPPYEPTDSGVGLVNPPDIHAANTAPPPHFRDRVLGPGGQGPGLAGLMAANTGGLSGRSAQLGSLLSNSQDWRTRIQQMAHHLAPGETIGRLAQGIDFAHQKGGPAEGAFGRLEHVADVHRASSALATYLGSKRPSKAY